MSLAELLAGRDLRAGATFEDRDPFDERYYGTSSFGGSTDSGIRVNEEVALKVSTVYAAIRVLSMAIAMVPLVTYKRLPDGGKVRATDDTLYPLLHDKPNNWQTSFRWRMSVMRALLLRGNSYNLLMPGRRTWLEQIVPLHPDRVRVVDQLADGRLVYEHTPIIGKARRIPQDLMLHFRGLSLDGREGVSVLRLMAGAVGYALAAEKHGAVFLRNAARPSVVLQHPGTFADPDTRDRIRSSWQAAQGGLDNVGQTAVLEEGMTVEKLTMTADEAQYTETRDFQIPEFLRFIGVPGVLVGYADKTATYASASEFFLSFKRTSVAPWAACLESEINGALILDKDHFVEFLLEALLRGDTLMRYKAHQLAIFSGWKHRNKVRQEESYNPDGEDLDQYLQPSNMQVVGDDDGKKGGGDIRKARAVARPSARIRRIVEEAAGRAARRETSAIHGAPGRMGAAKRFAAKPEEWASWVREFYVGHAQHLVQALQLSADVAEEYCAGQAAELLEHGVAATEGWDESLPKRLVALALEG